MRAVGASEELVYETGTKQVDGKPKSFWRVRGSHGVVELTQVGFTESDGVIGLHSLKPMHPSDEAVPCDFYEHGCYPDVTFRYATPLLESVLAGGDPRYELAEWYERLAK